MYPDFEIDPSSCGCKCGYTANDKVCNDEATLNTAFPCQCECDLTEEECNGRRLAHNGRHRLKKGFVISYNNKYLQIFC